MQDVTALLYGLKQNIKLIEAGNQTDDLLDEVCSDFLELLELLKLFLISERDSYYGYFLMNMQFRANVFSDSIAGIKLNTFPPVFESNPLLLCKFSLKEIIYVVCHEIDHVVLNHPAEMVKANPTGEQELFYHFNLAADAAVNDRINHEIIAEKHGFMAAPKGLITSGVLSKMFHLGKIYEMENYAYYFELIRTKGKRNNDMQNGAQQMMDALGDDDEASESGNGTVHQDEQNEDQSQEGNSSNDAEIEGDAGKQVVTAKNANGQYSDHNWEAGDDAENAAATIREFVNTAVSTMSEESRGLMPAYFMSQVEKINEPPKISWQKILKKYVGTITANKRKTRTRLNRRQPDRFDLSGTMDDKILKIVVCIDTSGSVDDTMIAHIFNEIFEILAKRKHEITIIECDAQVQRVYKAKTPKDIKLKAAGRGGTCFSPAIEYINNHKEFRDALMIYFTDGYGEREIPRPRTYRNMWVVIGDERNLSVKEPYGVVLSLVC